MKTITTLTAALATVALASSLSGAVRFYAEPSIALHIQDGLKNATGPLLAVGAAFDEKHSVDLEAGKFDSKFSSASFVEMEVIPVTFNYRYAFPITEKLSGAMGVSLGVMRQEFSVDPHYVMYGFSYSGDSDTAITGGFHAGISYRLNDHFAATLKGKALLTEEVKFSDQSNSLMIQLGLNCRF